MRSIDSDVGAVRRASRKSVRKLKAARVEPHAAQGVLGTHSLIEGSVRAPTGVSFS